MGSFVDLNLDGSPMKNGTDQMVAPTAPAQKYVTFDEDEPSTRTYDNTQPFTAPTVPSYGNPSGNYGNAPTYGDAPSGNYGNTTEDGYMPSGGGGGMVTENTGQPKSPGSELICMRGVKEGSPHYDHGTCSRNCNRKPRRFLHTFVTTTTQKAVLALTRN